jgi:malonyl-CoA O-methyltransferase
VPTTWLRWTSLPVCVDLLYSNLAVQWCENLTALSQEVARVLRPGGHALLSTLGPSTLWELRAAWRMLDSATHVNSFANPNQLRQQLAAAGLCIEVCRVESWTRRVDTVQQLARELRDIGAHNLNSGRQLGLTGRQRWRDLDKAYRQLHDAETGLPVTWQLCFLKVRKIAVAW